MNTPATSTPATIAMWPPRLGAAWLASIVLAGVLSGCATAPRQGGAPELAAQERRERAIAADDEWGLVGRIAVFDGKENGSGRIEWRQWGDRFEIVLSAPVSRQSWRLRGDSRGAVLEGLEGGARRAASAEDLLRAEAGWSVPLQKLRAWARGSRGAAAAGVAFAASGPALPAEISEDGWIVSYRDWFAGHQPPLPRRVFAHSGERRVRLAVERWLDAAELGTPASDG